MIFISTGFGRAELWAIKAGRSGVLGESDVAWKLKRNAPNKPSPILVDGLMYIVDDGGIASCLEAKTGTEVWKNRVKGNYSASPLYAEGKVYYFSEDGHTTVVEAGRTWKLLAENKLGDGFMASPAVAGDTLVLRSRTQIYRIGKR